MEKIISMVEFTIQQNMNFANKEIISVDKLQTIILKYAIFLKQPLILGMFVPCLPDGKPFSEFQLEILNSNDLVPELRKAFQEAKDRVLFEVTKEFLESNIYDENGFFYTLEIVEDLVASHNNYNLVLTESAKKQILGS